MDGGSDDDTHMRVLILGVGDAFTRRHFSTSALIAAPGGHVLIDCPDLVHRVVREASDGAGWGVDAVDVGDVILTHLHGDHCNGLESFGFLKRIMRESDPASERPRLYTVPVVAERLWERLAPSMDAPFSPGAPSQLDDFFDVRLLSLDAGAPAVDVAGLQVRCRLTTHSVPTIGLLIADGNGTLGWSGDTGFEAAHVEWLSEADVIVHESNLGSMHTPIERLNALPDEVRSKIRLIHLPDDFDPSCTDLKPLREGEVLEIGG